MVQVAATSGKWISMGLIEQVCTPTLLGYCVISLSKLTAPCCSENTCLLVLVNTTILACSLWRQEKISTDCVTRFLFSYSSWAISACPDRYLQIGGGHRGCIHNLSPTQFLKPHREGLAMTIEQSHILENHYSDTASFFVAALRCGYRTAVLIALGAALAVVGWSWLDTRCPPKPLSPSHPQLGRGEKIWQKACGSSSVKHKGNLTAFLRSHLCIPPTTKA